MDPLPPDPYEALGIQKDADAATIWSAYRKLLAKCDPDRFQDPDVRARMRVELLRIHEAYGILGDEKKRERYDDDARRIVLRKELDAKLVTKPRAPGPSGPLRQPGSPTAPNPLIPPHPSRKSDYYAEKQAYADAEGLDAAGFYHVRGPAEGCYHPTDRPPLSTQQARLEDDVKEKQDFMAFARTLYDDMRKAEASEPASATAFSGARTATPIWAKTASPDWARTAAPNRVSNESIEKEIQERNRAFEELKAAAPKTSATRTSVSKGEGAARSSDEPTKKDKLYAVPLEQLNLKVMNPNQLDARVDIVAVHGLGAIPDITWKERYSGTNWLSDENMLPAAVPGARILRFGYDSLWMGDTPIRTTLSWIAVKLLVCLGMIRTEDLERPLVFIGHCFGGLVIERALVLARMHHSRYPGIFDSTAGVIFLGTPHRGSGSFTQESALLAAIAASSDLYGSLEVGVLESMTSKSGGLLDVADDFITLCVDGGPKVSCFFEQRSSSLGKVIGRNDIKEYIVDATSATFDGHPKYGLEVDHFGLNKFDGPKNPNFVQVRAVTVGFYNAALKRAEAVSWSNPAPIFPAKPSARNPRSLVDDEDEDEDEEVRRRAIKELQGEEARKRGALQEADYKKRLAREKRAAEEANLERLTRNMRRYGIEDPEGILAANPLPRDEDLKSKQSVFDKDKWHRNRLKQVLLEEGLSGGQIDEILHDTGERMIIDGVETTITKMAQKWISTRTLDAYNIPWQYDEDDKSTIILKRWAPDYEKDFLWDHTYALREERGRRRNRDRDSSEAKPDNGKQIQEGQKMGLAVAAMRKLKSLQAAREKERSRREYYAEEPLAHADAYPHSGRSRTAKADSKNSNFGSRWSATPPSATTADFETKGRSSSVGSIHSAPDYEEVLSRRRNSGTLSRSREASPRRGQSAEQIRPASRTRTPTGSTTRHFPKERKASRPYDQADVQFSSISPAGYYPEEGQYFTSQKKFDPRDVRYSNTSDADGFGSSGYRGGF